MIHHEIFSSAPSGGLPALKNYKNPQFSVTSIKITQSQIDYKMKFAKIIVFGMATIKATPVGSNSSCNEAFDRCMEKLMQGIMVPECEPLPWWENGFYYEGPICDGTCRCLDKNNGRVSVTSDGVELDSENFDMATFETIDCTQFSSDKNNTSSLS